MTLEWTLGPMMVPHLQMETKEEIFHDPYPVHADLPIHYFPSLVELEAFLGRTSVVEKGFYVKIAKKSSGIPTVSYADATESALCFGWIPRKAYSYDDVTRWLRCTPRTVKSHWTKEDVKLVARLEKEGRLQAAGVAAADAAKKDGRWEKALGKKRATITTPAFLLLALIENPDAWNNYQAMKRTQRLDMVLRIYEAGYENQSEETEKAVRSIAEDASLSKLWTSRQKKRAKAQAEMERLGISRKKQDSPNKQRDSKSTSSDQQARRGCSTSSRGETSSTRPLIFSHVEIVRQSKPE